MQGPRWGRTRPPLNSGEELNGGEKQKVQDGWPAGAPPSEHAPALFLDPQKHKTGNLDLTPEVTSLRWEAASGRAEITIL